MTSETSQEAREYQEAEGRGLTRQRTIYDLVAKRPMTRLDVERTLGWKHQTVTSCIAEMILRGIMDETGDKVKQDGFNRAVVRTCAPFTDKAAKRLPGAKALRNAIATAIFQIECQEYDASLETLRGTRND